MGPKDPEPVVHESDPDTNSGVNEETASGEGPKEEEEASLGDRIGEVLERSKKDSAGRKTDEELSIFSDISGLSEDAGDELLPE